MKNSNPLSLRAVRCLLCNNTIRSCHLPVPHVSDTSDGQNESSDMILPACLFACFSFPRHVSMNVECVLQSSQRQLSTHPISEEIKVMTTLRCRSTTASNRLHGFRFWKDHFLWYKRIGSSGVKITSNNIQHWQQQQKKRQRQQEHVLRCLAEWLGEV